MPHGPTKPRFPLPVFWARLPSFGQLGLIGDPQISSKLKHRINDPKGLENKIYTMYDEGQGDFLQWPHTKCCVYPDQMTAPQVNPIALRKAKIVYIQEYKKYNFGLSECNRVKEIVLRKKTVNALKYSEMEVHYRNVVHFQSQKKKIVAPLRLKHKASYVSTMPTYRISSAIRRVNFLSK